jgi:hypothetical protein
MTRRGVILHAAASEYARAPMENANEAFARAMHVADYCVITLGFNLDHVMRTFEYHAAIGE